MSFVDLINSMGLRFFKIIFTLFLENFYNGFVKASSGWDQFVVGSYCKQKFPFLFLTRSDILSFPEKEVSLFPNHVCLYASSLIDLVTFLNGYVYVINLQAERNHLRYLPPDVLVSRFIKIKLNPHMLKYLLLLFLIR